MSFQNALTGALGRLSRGVSGVFHRSVEIVRSAGSRVLDAVGVGGGEDVYDLPGPLNRDGTPSPEPPSTLGSPGGGLPRLDDPAYGDWVSGIGNTDPNASPSILGRITRGAENLVRGGMGVVESILDVFGRMGLGGEGGTRDMGGERPEASQGSRNATQQPGQATSRAGGGPAFGATGDGFGMGPLLLLGLGALALGWFVLRKGS